MIRYFLAAFLILLTTTALAAPQKEPQLAKSESAFDGKTLNGWVTSGGRYDGRARWTVEDGVLVGRQGSGKSGGLIYSERIYENAIISFEVKIDYPFDSGVFLRMAPPGNGKGAQVTLDYRPKGEVGAIYADGFLFHNETAKEAFKKDAWNRVTVRISGLDFHLQAWLNGVLITDYQLPANSKGYAPRGLIGLQVHGGESVPDEQSVRFRDIRIRELPNYDRARFSGDDHGQLQLLDEAKAAGWRSLFDGKTLSGWKPGGKTKADDYLVRDGCIVFPRAGGDGFLRTEREDWRDFELRLDFKIAFMCNSGLFLRSDPKSGNPSYSGCEVQILDDWNWERVSGYRLKPYQFTGGLYGSVAPAIKNATKPLGGWNTYQVRYRGFRIKTVLNGHVLYDVDTKKVPASGKPFSKRATQGFIGLQRHAPPQAKSDYAWFRNIFIREIK
ncbi:MAG: DUF1080 domain-containing protein [Planctomycetota bacterium]